MTSKRGPKFLDNVTRKTFEAYIENHQGEAMRRLIYKNYISSKLDDETFARLDQLAKGAGKTRSEMLRMLINQNLRKIPCAACKGQCGNSQ